MAADVEMEFTTEEQFADVQNTLEKAFANNWDVSTLESAPPSVTSLVDDLGGLRPNQKLYTEDSDSKILVFAAWWPWGGGQKVSLRVSATFQSAENSDEAHLHKHIRSCFGLEK